ncbi:hypothetical protein ACFV9C_28740 [Kribbella sp. NPDC059898]|uniref:hypothetical protein n=1 Tax=Kribbella sp. NPDC059898 TaxID=3346995 RepID=UPI003646FFDC
MRRMTLSRPGSRGFVRTYLPMIIALTLLTVAGAVAATVTRPTSYVASSEVIVYPDPARVNSAAEPDMGTQRTVASSGVVTNAAAVVLHTSPGEALKGLSVSVPVNANVLQFSYKAPTAERALTGVAAFTRAYINYRNQNRKIKLADVITQPVLPDRPTQPNLPLVIGLGLVLGAMIGAGFAFVWDRARGRMRDHGDVTRTTGLPVLADVPTILQRLPLRPEAGPPGPLGEVFGYLAAQLTTLPARGRGACFVVTSPARRAGTTTVASQLAIALANTGKEVVLIGGDLRRPALHTVFGADESPGLTDVLADSRSLDRALVPTAFDGLRLLPGGRPPAGAAPWFNVEDLELLIDNLSTRALVVIDTPAVTTAAEAALLAGRSNFVLVVLDARKGRRSPAAAAVTALKSAGGNPIGCVMNAPPRRSVLLRPLVRLRSGSEVNEAPRIAPIANPAKPSRPSERAGDAERTDQEDAEPGGSEPLAGTERANT